MPTVITHAALGWGLARVLRRQGPPEHARPREVLAATVALLPDLDVIAFSLGIPYGHPLGHRGVSHSLAFGLALGLGAWLVLRGLSRVQEAPPRPGALDLLVLCLASLSHGLLDMATAGGLGVALLAPFSNERLFWTVRPIPVSPIGLGPFLVYGWPVLLWEALLVWPLAGLAGLAGGTGRGRWSLAAAAALLTVTGAAWATRLGAG